MTCRNKKITVRLTPDEYADLKEKSDTSGLKMEPLIRSLIAGCTIKAKPSKSYIEMINAFSAIGNNLNQIAHIANYSKTLSSAQIEDLNRFCVQLWDIVSDYR